MTTHFWPVGSRKTGCGILVNDLRNDTQSTDLRGVTCSTCLGRYPPTDRSDPVAIETWLES